MERDADPVSRLAAVELVLLNTLRCLALSGKLTAEDTAWIFADAQAVADEAGRDEVSRCIDRIREWSITDLPPSGET